MFKGICVALSLAEHGVEIRDSSYQWWPQSGKLDQPDPADGGSRRRLSIVEPIAKDHTELAYCGYLV